MSAPLWPGQVRRGPKGHTVTVGALVDGLAHCSWPDGAPLVVEVEKLEAWELVSGPVPPVAPPPEPEAPKAPKTKAKTKPLHLPGLHALAPRSNEVTCTVCGKAIARGSLLHLEGVCSTACLKADGPRRARYQDPTWRP